MPIKYIYGEHLHRLMSKKKRKEASHTVHHKHRCTHICLTYKNYNLRKQVLPILLHKFKFQNTATATNGQCGMGTMGRLLWPVSLQAKVISNITLAFRGNQMILWAEPNPHSSVQPLLSSANEIENCKLLLHFTINIHFICVSSVCASRLCAMHCVGPPLVIQYYAMQTQ